MGLSPNPAQLPSGVDPAAFWLTEVTEELPVQLYCRLGRNNKELLYQA